jgi:hypothetical protein
MRRQIISVCCVSFQAFKKGTIDELEHIVNNQTITMKPPVKDYMNYSHTYCAEHLQAFYDNKELWRT